MRNTKFMIMMSMKSTTWIANLMAPVSEIRALGRDEYDHIVNMY